MTKKELAQSICNLVGESNIRTIANCYTRVRLTVKDPEKMRREELKKLEGVLGVIEEGSHVQLVLGPGTAAAVAQLMSDMTQIKSEEVDEAVLLKEENRAKNNVPYKNMLKKIANIFIPIIPAFIACGLVVAVYESSYVFFPGFQDTDFGKIMSALAYSVFTILPIIVGYNTSKEFGGSPIIGAVLASILNSSSLAGVQLFHVSITPGRGGVISVLIIAYVAVLLEKQLQKVIPDFLDMFLRPLITVCVMTFVGLMVFQPIGGFISETIGAFVSFIIYKVPVLAGLASAIYLPLVMTGMHHGLIAVNTQLIADFGVTYLLPVTCMAGAGQVGAAFYVYLKTKNQRLKKTIKNALPVGMLGIGEPLMWGCTIPLGKPFIASCIGGGIGGSVMAVMKVAAKVPELSGIPLAFITTRFPLYFVGLFASYAAGFIVCRLMGFTDPED